jgi:putative OPT family oligopeptide transporter
MSSEPETTTAPAEPDTPQHQPYIPDAANIPEFTWPSLLVGAILGIIFGASSLYLLMKVSMTVSASVPIAVLSITLFRAFSKYTGVRRTTILENNVVQTTGSAGESLAFGVGVTMPALLLLGFEMDPIRVMTVSVLGGLLGILLMIPLRKAFIVKQHGKLKYPEGTACAEVLVAGEKGGASAKMVFIGFGIALVHKFLMKACKLWTDEPAQNLYSVDAAGKTAGLKGAAISGDPSPEMLGVGYLIGPKIACWMMAGAVLSFFVIGPLIAHFGEGLTKPVPPAKTEMKDGKDMGLIKNMDPNLIYKNYLKYIGAGAVAAGGIISMLKAMPLIIGSIVGGMRDLRSTRRGGGGGIQRTERDLPLSVVGLGSIGLVILLMAIPQMGLGFTFAGFLGAVMVLVFGFLFVTVSSRLTGEVGSSSNPISGMTIATLLLTCIIFYTVAKTLGLDPSSFTLTALSIAAVVCIASSNGGTTSQDLKTGYLVGSTPKYQQFAILIGALTSAVAIGGVLLLMNSAQSHYTTKGFPSGEIKVDLKKAVGREKPGRPYNEGKLLDEKEYYIVHANDEEYKYLKDGKVEYLPAGRYLVNDEGFAIYRTDVPIDRKRDKMDNDENAPEKFKAAQPQLFQLIIKGILGGTLEWNLIIAGALIAVALELLGVSSLAVAVGMYLGLDNATPIFIGGMLRWATDRLRGGSGSDVETETSPGVLLSSGYIAGGTLCGLLIAFVSISGATKVFDLSPTIARTLEIDKQPDVQKELAKIEEPQQKDKFLSGTYLESDSAKLGAVGMFFLMAVVLFVIGSKKSPELEKEAKTGYESSGAPPP